MRQFVAQQPLPRHTPWLVSAWRKVNVVALRVGHRTDRTSPRVFVHPDGGEIVAERCLHLALYLWRQRAAAIHVFLAVWSRSKEGLPIDEVDAVIGRADCYPI
jgi:hypothetical protein